MESRDIILCTEEQLQKSAKFIENYDWANPKIYGNWLAQTYYFVSHSTRLLGAAASRFQLDRDNIHMQLLQHAKEEKSHEKLARADLKGLGLTPQDFLELATTKALYRSVYYAIDRVNPIALYGYVYFLEMWAVVRGQEIMDAAQKAFGPKTISFLKVHLSEDVDHVKMYTKFFDDCSQTELAIVKEYVEDTGQCYLHILEEIQRAANTRTKTKLAA